MGHLALLLLPTRSPGWVGRKEDSPGSETVIRAFSAFACLANFVVLLRGSHCAVGFRVITISRCDYDHHPYFSDAAIRHKSIG